MTLADWINGAPEAPPAPPDTFGDYAKIDALNWSTLSLMATSAKLLRYRVDHPRQDTPDLRRGRLIHLATLEPERFAREVIAHPDLGDGRTKEGKARKAEFLASVPPGATVVEPEEYERALVCADAVRRHPSAGPLLRSGRVEVSMRWEIDGVACKARADFLAPTYLCDLKSTRQDSLRGIVRDVADYLYHGQLAWYHDGAVRSRHISDGEGPYIIAVQHVEPFDVVVLRVGIEALERGRALYRSLLDRYVACQAADWWPGLAPEVVTLQLPAWAAGGDGEEQDW